MFKNNGSTALVVCVLIALVGGLAIQISLDVNKHYSNSKSSSEKKHVNLQTNQFDLLLTTERFQFKTPELPLWYPDPYPTQVQLQESDKPLLQIISPVKDTSNAMVTLTEKVTTEKDIVITLSYDLDRTAMGSILKVTDVEKLEKKNGKRTQSQPAYVATGDLAQLNQDNLKDFFSLPATSWPKSGRILSSLGSSKIYFDSYITETLPDSTLLIKGVNVGIERNSSKGMFTRNLAALTIPPPPVPDCTLELASGAQPLLPNTPVQVRFSSNSITNSAALNYLGLTTPQTIAIGPQSIRNVGKFTAINASGVVKLTVPDPSLFPANPDGTKKWEITGTVVGVDSRLSAKTCTLDLKVVDPDAKPTVTLTLNGQRGILKVPFYSSVSVAWTSNLATSCTLNGTAVALNGALSTANLAAETLYTIRCKNLAGEASDSSSVKFNSKWYQVDGAYCPTFCSGIGKVNTVSVEYYYPTAGSKCTSGEMRSGGAIAAGIKFTHGCWGDGGCPYARTWNFPISYGGSCYNSVGKATMDGDWTDVTIGCHCADP